MTLEHPAWLVLLFFAVLVGWRWRSLRLQEPLRAAVVVLLVFALAGLRTRWGDDGRDVWVLVDRSASAAGPMAQALPEWEQLLARGRGPADRLHYVDFGTEAVLRERGDPEFRGGTGSTRLAAAIRHTLGETDPDRPSRLLVLTDGQTTDDLGGVAEALVRAHVALDYRLLPGTGAVDFQLSELRLPTEVEPGAGFLIEATVTGPGDATVPWELLRDGQIAGRGTTEVRAGTGRIRLLDRIAGTGVGRYEVRIAPKPDAHPENNRATAWVRSGGRNRVILVSAFADDPLADVLRAGGANVDVVTQAEQLQPGHLSGARVVVLHNVPAWRVNRTFIDALDFFVNNQGGGLLMVGGRGSFASGGWFETPLDPLLPVSMEMRQDQRKLAVALAIIMDRSGSMAASAGPGLTKMDLADAGAARAAELLGDMDYISVHAVDSEAHEVLPIIPVQNNRDTIEKVVRRVTSMGGGIFVYNGLEAGWKELQKAQVGQRHLVLFADAADSEEPGDYETLLKEMRDDGATVSVIGLGTESDSDAGLLIDIAERGGGRMFFADDAAMLPEVFAQETVTIARSAFIDEPVGLAATPGWREIAAQPLTWLPQIDGYNLSYLRPGATAAALSQDDYAAPLVATWQRGAGRAAAVTFPLGGDFSERARGWSHYSDFARTLTRWLAGADTPPGLGLRTEVTGDELRLSLYVDDALLADATQRPPALIVAQGTDGAAQSVPWERIAPGEFEARAPIAPSAWVRGAVQVGPHAIPFGPVGAIAQAEWLVLPERVAALRTLSSQSGGEERLDLSAIWSAPIPPSSGDAARWLLTIALVLVLADALLTRLGVQAWRRRRSEM